MQQSEDSPDYFRKREAQERDLAAQAADEAVKKIHLALAEEYRRLAGRSPRGG